MEKKINEIKKVLQEAYQMILEATGKHLLVETKTNRKDLVTQVDKNVQAFITQQLQKRYPSDRILGEETYQGQQDISGNIWIIDPIDGTTNFVKQQKDYGILLAYYQDGVGQLGFILDGNNGDLYIAQRGKGVLHNDQILTPLENTTLRDSLINCSVDSLYKHGLVSVLCEKSFGIRYKGSAVQDGLMVIRGESGAFLTYLSGPWDFAAHIIFAKELGLSCLKQNGSDRGPLDSGFTLFAKPSIAQEILTIIKGV